MFIGKYADVLLVLVGSFYDACVCVCFAAYMNFEAGLEVYTIRIYNTIDRK